MGSYFRLYIRNNNVHTDWKGSDEYLSAGGLKFFFMRVFVKFTNPVLKIFDKITPEFLARPIVPLYVAFYFYLIRFYLMPWLLGYGTMGMLSFPIDSEFSKELYRLFSPDK